ncbi:ACT domain-containing protein [Actinomadura barringtoniae]|uniref:ACT domain-containing protein n=1 Tax=Actinomadura barringtoniae TaxID=1427535 RepID=A0A939T572_9ACTN|nr:ACT domain-containing protein [Actinomadura barringtoniae]MBO2449169.1 ACT domain-containing protein [Actinomadura barringtoniae]
MATGETDLGRLLAGLDPELHDGEYVFATLRARTLPVGVEPVMTFEEDEGRTLVLPREQAERAGLDATFSSAWITLRIHSSLEAVGMMAAIATALANAGISCNAISAFYHDHIFVPCERADEAVALLRGLTEK